MKNLSTLFALIALIGFIVLIIAFVLSSENTALIGGAALIFGITLNVILNSSKLVKL